MSDEINIDEARDMIAFFVGQIQMHSPKMDGNHSWRFHNLWPMTHCVGPTPLDAVRAAMAEIKRARQSEECDK